jgi:hypothetical protein
MIFCFHHKHLSETFTTLEFSFFIDRGWSANFIRNDLACKSFGFKDHRVPYSFFPRIY